MKALKIVSYLLAAVCFCSFGFSLYFFGAVLADLFQGDLSWVVNVIVIVVALYHYIALAIVSVPCIAVFIACGIKKQRCLLLVVAYALALFGNTAVFLLGYLAK